MGEIFNWLKTTEAAVGAVTAVAGVIWWMVRWFDRHQQARADSVLSDISREGASHAERVAELAVRVGNLEAGHGALEDKMILVQEQLKGLATARDMEALRGDIRENNANTAAEVRMITGMVDTLYKAALEAGKNRPARD